MILGEILAKMAKQETCTAQEIDFVKMQGNMVQTFNNALSSAGSLHLQAPFITSPVWDDSPLGSYRLSVTEQYIDDGLDIATPIQFDTTQRPSRFFRLESNGTNISIVDVDTTFLVHISFRLWTLADVKVSCAVASYNQGGTLLGTDNLVYATNDVGTIGIGVVDPIQYAGISYVKILISHNDTVTGNCLLQVRSMNMIVV